MDKSFEKRIPQSPKSPMRNKTKKITDDFEKSSPSKYSCRFIPNRTDSPTNMYSKTEPKITDSNNQKDKYQELLSELLSPSETILNYETKTQQNTSFFSFTQKPKSVLEQSNTRKIHPNPVKVLDAPYLQDDFYLNLVDWGSLNVLAVGLSDTVYLWNASTTKVTSLCTLPNETAVTSVSWMNNGKFIAVGNNSGGLEIYDAERSQLIHTYSGHSQRVSSLSWNGNVISSGSRDRDIKNRDIRSKKDAISTFKGHKQEVCGLKWSPDGKELASGGNDNKLFVWSSQSDTHLYKFSEHCAAVKAIAWNPHQHGVLASGGGTADKKLRFWNTSNGSCTSVIDTGSQICNISWSSNVNEFVTTHGFSQNQIMVWKYPSLQSIATLTGHTYRVLYLSVSPDGQTICTGAGDETLRFWNIFPPSKYKESYQSKIQFEIR